MFVRIFCELLPLRNFCDQKFVKGYSLKFFLIKLVTGNAVQIFSIFPPKVLVSDRKIFLNTFSLVYN